MGDERIDPLVEPPARGPVEAAGGQGGEALSRGKRDRQSSVSETAGCSSRRRMWFSRTSASIAVRVKQRHASSGDMTIGSPRTLNDVLTTTGQPVLSLNAERIAW